MTHHCLRDTADEQPIEPSPPVRTHHNEIGGPLARGPDDGVTRIRVARRHAGMKSFEFELRGNPLD